MKVSFHRIIPVLGVALLLAVAGCDTDALTEDTIFLTHEITSDVGGDPITFSFSADDVDTGRLQDISCNCSIDVEAYLTSQGFSKADLQAATIQSAELVMLFPISERLNFMEQAILKLSASGISPTEVANRSSFPNSRQSNLTILPNRDVATFLEKSSFSALLQIQPGTLQAGANYDISIIIRVRMEVSGL